MKVPPLLKGLAFWVAMVATCWLWAAAVVFMIVTATWSGLIVMFVVTALALAWAGRVIP